MKRKFSNLNLLQRIILVLGILLCGFVFALWNSSMGSSLYIVRILMASAQQYSNYFPFAGTCSEIVQPSSAGDSVADGFVTSYPCLGYSGDYYTNHHYEAKYLLLPLLFIIIYTCALLYLLQKHKEDNKFGVAIRLLRASSIGIAGSFIVIFIIIFIVHTLSNNILDNRGTVAPDLRVVDVPFRPTITPPPTSQPANASFPKRQFDSSVAFYGTHPYPTEVVSIPLEKLVGLHCSPHYISDDNGGFVSNTPNSGSDKKIVDPNIQRYSVIESPTVGNARISAGQYCDTQESNTIFEYEVWGGGGGTRNVSYFGQANTDQVLLGASIHNDGVPYFGCSILELTTDNILYTQCFGGDAGSGGSSIYAIDLIKKNVRKLIACTSKMVGNTPNVRATISCT